MLPKTIGDLAASGKSTLVELASLLGVEMAVLTNVKSHLPAVRPSDIPIKSCSWLPSTESAVWVEVGGSGFAARGRIIGDEEVKLATSPTRHYLVALARAEAWAELYKVPVVYVIAPARNDD